jgi:hypothetical protein
MPIQICSPQKSHQNSGAKCNNPLQTFFCIAFVGRITSLGKFVLNPQTDTKKHVASEDDSYSKLMK